VKFLDEIEDYNLRKLYVSHTYDTGKPYLSYGRGIDKNGVMLLPRAS